jgi:hypothetical protein
MISVTTMEKLTPEEKDALYQRDHSIGGHNGCRSSTAITTTGWRLI